VLVGSWLPLPIAILVPLNLCCFFALATVCHGELASQRPEADRLTEFYFYLSLGGVLGGLFNAILAPMLFPGVWEFPLVLTLACLVAPGSQPGGRRKLIYDILLPLTLFVFPLMIQFVPKPQGMPISLCGKHSRVILGDARLALADASDGLYDAIIIDAFTSDSIPIHLLTREAVALYFTKLADNGVLLFHISNRYMDLMPIIAAVAEDSGAEARYSSYQPPSGISFWRSTTTLVVAIAKPGGDLDFLSRDAGWSLPPSPPTSALWTDQRSNIVGSIRWLN
jgi:hypothetical protein